MLFHGTPTQFACIAIGSIAVACWLHRGASKLKERMRQQQGR